jgi:hypothetical protein
VHPGGLCSWGSQALMCDSRVASIEQVRPSVSTPLTLADNIEGTCYPGLMIETATGPPCYPGLIMDGPCVEVRLVLKLHERGTLTRDNTPKT